MANGSNWLLVCGESCNNAWRIVGHDQCVVDTPELICDLVWSRMIKLYRNVQL